MILYHGSDHKIPVPEYGKGKKDNDYGQGFYMTADIDKAAEWAIANGSDTSIINKYNIDLSNLNIINLDKYGILTWIAEIISNRGVRGEQSEILGEKIADKYKIDISQADIVIGYRADDSYMDIVEAFLQNQIDIDEVEKMFYKGKLGLQYFIQSPKAFELLQFKGYEIVNETQYPKYRDDIIARIEVSKFLKQRSNQILLNGFYPLGITARDAVKYTYNYNNEYKFYELVNYQNNYNADKGDKDSDCEFEKE